MQFGSECKNSKRSSSDASTLSKAIYQRNTYSDIQLNVELSRIREGETYYCWFKSDTGCNEGF